MLGADDILNLIDAGLQSSDEHGYGTDQAPLLCARCQVGQLDDGHDICVSCRAFLAGDDKTDPASPRVSVTAVAFTRAMSVAAMRCAEQLRVFSNDRYEVMLSALCRDEDRAAQIRAQFDTTYSAEHLFKAITWGYTVDHTCALLAFAALLPWHETELLFRIATPVVYARWGADRSLSVDERANT